MAEEQVTFTNAEIARFAERLREGFQDAVAVATRSAVALCLESYAGMLRHSVIGARDERERAVARQAIDRIADDLERTADSLPSLI
jgi:hypothetical protein